MKPEFDNDQAEKEGWAIFSVSGYTEEHKRTPWQLQRYDEEQKFPGDYEAWVYVANKAINGSGYHRKALAFLKENSLPEFEKIVESLLVTIGG